MQLKDRQDMIADLYISKRHIVNGLCQRYVYNYHEREELVNEIFIKCFENIDRFESRCSLSTWLYRISVNACCNHIRKINTNKRKGFSVEFNDANVPTSKAVQLNGLIDKELRSNINLIYSLSNEYDKKQIECFLLVHVDGLSYKDVATATGRSVNGVRQQLNRAKKILQNKLKKIYGSMV